MTGVSAKALAVKGVTVSEMVGLSPGWDVAATATGMLPPLNSAASKEGGLG